MKILLASALAACVAVPAAAAVTVSYEAPGVQNSTIVLDWGGVETFNSRAIGANQTFSTDYGTGAAPVVITGTYTNVDIRRRDQFGGAEGIDNYAEVDGAAYSIDFTTSNGRQLNYFGFWLSALDRGNQVSFFDGATEVFSLTPADVKAFTGSCPASPYCGNPNAPLGRNPNEPYVFVNVRFDGLGGPSGFDRIVWSENPDVGDYETDNHTVGYIAAIPEPATWAMLIMGFGLVGMAARRRGRPATTLA
jgi:hypothetical protein